MTTLETAEREIREGGMGLTKDERHALAQELARLRSENAMLLEELEALRAFVRGRASRPTKLPPLNKHERDLASGRKVVYGFGDAFVWKISAIKAYRARTGLSLHAANDVVERYQAKIAERKAGK